MVLQHRISALILSSLYSFEKFRVKTYLCLRLHIPVGKMNRIKRPSYHRLYPERPIPTLHLNRDASRKRKVKASSSSSNYPFGEIKVLLIWHPNVKFSNRLYATAHARASELYFNIYRIDALPSKKVPPQ